jgi:hypothetical protein
MKMIGAKVPPPIYEAFTQQAKAKGVSLSEHIRTLLSQAIEKSPDDNLSAPELTADNRGTAILEGQIGEKDKQLNEKDQQISELHQLLAIQTKSTAQLTEQLEVVKPPHAPEARRSWWSRLTQRG